MSDRIHRAVYLETPLNIDDVRTTFAQCGEIRGLYLAGTCENSVGFKYYIEYRDQRAAKHACILQIPDTTVYEFESSPQLVDLFRSVTFTGLPPKPQEDVLQTARWAPYWKKKSRRSQHNSSPATYTILEPATSMTHSSSCTASEVSPRPRADSFDKENYLHCSPSPAWTDHSPDSVASTNACNPLPTAYMHPNNQAFSDSMSGMSTSTEPSSHLPALGSIDTMFSHMVHDSELIFYNRPCRDQVDVDNLDDSPDTVIEVLKLAAGHSLECAKWVIVAAQYRRRGNVPAAIAVITSMIEVMLSVGMDISQLKPAVLMLSSCHLDIARQLRMLDGTDTPESKLHREKACDGFRQIYGDYQPDSSTAEDDSHPDVNHAAPLPARDPSIANLFATVSRNAVTDDVRPGLPGRHPVTPEAAPRTAEVRHAPGTPMTPKASMPSPSHGQIRMLEREIQALRDKQQKHQDSLHRARMSKRKLQDELDREQHRRRKLEDQFEKAEKATAEARRGEECALKQCHAEIETRRRAEDCVERLRGIISVIEPKVAESEERDRKTREYFGKLGVAFLKAARGDMGDVPAAVKM
ncbi:hypothetical protein C8Q80DRAFT_1272492 [Daedaleopsis nitida]|nr:hypothetical protein C8Q80DRAFT_1272492 [Daedaleopsis nitida]